MRRKWDDQSVAQLLQTFTGRTNGRAKCVKVIHGSDTPAIRAQQNHGFSYRIIILLSLLQIFVLMCDWIGRCLMFFFIAGDKSSWITPWIAATGWWLQCQLWHFSCRQWTKAPFIPWIEITRFHCSGSKCIKNRAPCMDKKRKLLLSEFFTFFNQFLHWSTKFCFFFLLFFNQIICNL